MKKQAEEPTGIRDRNVENLSTVSEDCDSTLVVGLSLDVPY